MRGSNSLSVIGALLAAACASGGRTPPDEAIRTFPPDTLLRAIEARGRALAAYDQAAWHATDAVLALAPLDGLVTHYIARPVSEGWLVSFGRLSADTGSFLVAFEAHPGDAPTRFRAVAVTPARADTGYLLRAARAVTLTRHDFGPLSRPYNVAVLPDERAEERNGAWLVYHFPAVTIDGVWPHGGDVRYRVSDDGRRVLEKRQLHRAILEFAAPAAEKPETGLHTAIVDDIVEDTDVFLVLARKPAMQELIVSKSYYFRISVDGRITCMLRTD